MIILLHSSKTMRAVVSGKDIYRRPQLIDKAIRLDGYLKTLSTPKIGAIMSVSENLARKTHDLIQRWSPEEKLQRPAIDSFLGDIFSGLQAIEWTNDDREYADQQLRILSGLYGILRPLDGICPYRLEMGYRLPKQNFANLYEYWGGDVAATLPARGTIINLAAVEYSKLVTPFVDSSRIITPVFLTVDSKTGEPEFVVVHAKIARGAFGSWLVKGRISDPNQLPAFNGIGYRFNEALSQPLAPVFVCQKFGGKGLSLRLK